MLHFLFVSVLFLDLLLLEKKMSKLLSWVPSVVLSIYKNIGNFKRFNSRFCLLLRGYRLIRTSYAEIYHKLQNQNLFSKIMFNQHI